MKCWSVLHVAIRAHGTWLKITSLGFLFRAHTDQLNRDPTHYPLHPLAPPARPDPLQSSYD